MRVLKTGDLQYIVDQTHHLFLLSSIKFMFMHNTESISFYQWMFTYVMFNDFLLNTQDLFTLRSIFAPAPIKMVYVYQFYPCSDYLQSPSTNKIGTRTDVTRAVPKIENSVNRPSTDKVKKNKLVLHSSAFFISRTMNIKNAVVIHRTNFRVRIRVI